MMKVILSKKMIALKVKKKIKINLNFKNTKRKSIKKGLKMSTN